MSWSPAQIRTRLKFSYNPSIFPFKVTGQDRQELVIASNVRLTALLRGIGSVLIEVRGSRGSKIEFPGTNFASWTLSQYAHRSRDLTDALPCNWRSIMKRFGIHLTMALGILALAACGNTTGDRGLSGAGIGAAVGAVGGALVGAPLAGAAIGAGVGAATGALTSPSTVDLGKPVWER
jgi:hypothetical protein